MKMSSCKKSSPLKYYGGLSFGCNVFLRCHTDNDFTMSMAHIHLKGKDQYTLTDNVVVYFCFPTLGVAVPLQPGDFLLFNAQIPHCVSSRCKHTDQIMVKHQDQKWDDLVDENKRLKLELRKLLSSNSRGTNGDIRKDNDWNGEEVNLLDRVSLFCCDYLFPQFKFLSDNWQKYDAKNENSLSYFVGAKMKMNHMNRYKDLWERVFVPTIPLKYQTICCNLNNAIKWIQG